MNVLRSEWIKTRTIRMNWVLFIIAIVFPLVVAGLFAGFGDVDALLAEDQLRLVSGGIIITSMLLGVIGATSITGEYGFNTIRPTFAATPRRIRVISAKAVVAAAVALGVGLVVTVAGLALVNTLARARVDASVPDSALDVTSATDFWQVTAGIVVFCALLGLFGLAIGLIIRSTPAAVATLVLWPLLVENIVSAILAGLGVDNPGKWMPYQAGANLWQSGDFSGTLGRWGGGLYFAGATLVLFIAGTVITNRRDA
jgi:ABC-2 type transport system permease protein